MVADITMCSNTSCKIREKCYRQQATPKPFWQSWAMFKPDSDVEVCLDKTWFDKKLYCENFIEMEEDSE